MYLGYPCNLQLFYTGHW